MDYKIENKAHWDLLRTEAVGKAMAALNPLVLSTLQTCPIPVSAEEWEKKFEEAFLNGTYINSYSYVPPISLGIPRDDNQFISLVELMRPWSDLYHKTIGDIENKLRDDGKIH